MQDICFEPCIYLYIRELRLGITGYSRILLMDINMKHTAHIWNNQMKENSVLYSSHTDQLVTRFLNVELEVIAPEKVDPTKTGQF
jgi:hypothetical protein